MVRRIRQRTAMVLSVSCLLLRGAYSDESSYFPLREGNYWVYSFQAQSRVTERRDDIVHLELNGIPVTLRDRGTEIDVELPAGGYALLYRFVPDSSWEYYHPGDFCNYGSPVTVAIEAEPVVTPAGVFRDCLHLEFERNECLHGGFREQWWAPDVGLVKWVEEFVGEVELTEYCLEGDECAAWFTRGDANADGTVDISDAIALLPCLFSWCQDPPCWDAADANDDGTINIADPIAILAHLFAEAGPLPQPFGVCGIDRTEDMVTCESFPPCQ